MKVWMFLPVPEAAIYQHLYRQGAQFKMRQFRLYALYVVRMDRRVKLPVWLAIPNYAL